MNQFRPVTMIARTTPGTHNPRISAQIVINHLREIGERPPYTMYVLYAAFLFGLVHIFKYYEDRPRQAFNLETKPCLKIIDVITVTILNH